MITARVGFVLAGVLLLYQSASAQILPPTTIYKWKGTGATANWATATNWQGFGGAPNGVPPNYADVLLGDYATSAIEQTVNLGTGNLRSIWFTAGSWFTLQATNGFSLGGGPNPPPNGNLLVVNSPGWQKQSEINIESPIFVAARDGWIENYSEGGLRIGGGDHNTAGRTVIVGGSGATHFASSLYQKGTIIVANNDSGLATRYNGPYPTHLILSGNNTAAFSGTQAWTGALIVGQRGFAVVKENQALGTGGVKQFSGGGTLGFRSHIGNILNYTAPQNAPDTSYGVTVSGQGVVRAGDLAIPNSLVPIGAIYNDGGRNIFNMRVNFWGDTWFGSRGDRGGSLELKSRVSGSLLGAFTKVGPGLIILSNSVGPSASDMIGAGNSNYWFGDTVIRDGVLRLGSTTALPAYLRPVGGGLYVRNETSNIVLAGGILELGAGNFSRALGTAGGQIRWAGSGGFSAYGTDRFVSIGSALNWGQKHFLRYGQALLLSSRYATANITFQSSINLGAIQPWISLPGEPDQWAPMPEIRVERGEWAHAIISGNISSEQGMYGHQGLVKTGRGLLRLTGTNTYRGGTIIRDGALRGNLPGGSVGQGLRLDGGVYGIDTNRSFTLGNAMGQVRWLSSGGFAAYSDDWTVTIKNLTFNNGATLNWGSTTNFVANGQELRFGHYTADAKLNFTNPLYLGLGGIRTIRIERGNSELADVVFSSPISGGNNQIGPTLNLVGDGIIALTANNTALLRAKVNIYGATLRLDGENGSISNVTEITLKHGGTLWLDEHQSIWGGVVPTINRINNDTNIYFEAGTLRYGRNTTQTTALPEKVGHLVIRTGENITDFPVIRAGGDDFPQIHATSLWRDNVNSRAVLYIFGKASISNPLEGARLTLDTSASWLGVNDNNGQAIIPWAAYSDGWAIPYTQSNKHYVVRLLNYETGGQNHWGSARNVKLTTTRTLSTNRTPNSLYLAGGTLSLGNNRTFTIRSGGLLSGYGSNGLSNIIKGTGLINTANSRPLYAHTFTDLSIEDSAGISLGSDLVKGQSGSLILDSNVTHSVRNVYLHRGTLDLRQGTLSINNRIYIGDGGGDAKLILAPDRWDQIVSRLRAIAGAPKPKPDITLNGTPYDPRGPEYGGSQAVLQMGGNTKLHLGNLHIENRGTIDWVGGEVGKANILWVESLTFSGTDPQLFIRNWYEYEDILLVRRVGFNYGDLSKIVFEGYQNYQTTWKDYDANYLQITPFAMKGAECPDCPEPTTYGAILGGLGLALVIWRRRKAGHQCALPLAQDTAQRGRAQ